MTLRKQMVVAVVSLIAVGALSSWTIGRLQLHQEAQELVSREHAQVLSMSARFEGYLQGAVNILESLSGEARFSAALAESHPEPLVTPMLREIITRHPQFHQVRWLDESGREQVRLQRFGREVLSLPDGELQDKSSRYYFSETIQLLRGQVYFSDIDLNMENGRVEQPFRPMVRLAIRVFDNNGVGRGIVVINQQIDPLQINPDTPETVSTGLVLNTSGDYLRGFSSEQEWGFMFDQPQRLGQSYPDAWETIWMQNDGLLERDNLWTWSTVALANAANAPRVKLVRFVSAETLTAMQWQICRSILMVSTPVTLLLCLLAMALLHSRHHHRQTSARLEISERLRQMTSDLLKVRARAQNLVESSINGILIVDNHGVIVLANPALNSMFGYHEGELVGQQVEVLIPEHGRKAHQRMRHDYLQQPSRLSIVNDRHVYGRHKQGHKIPLEISLSPVDMDGELEVSATVMDISQRLHSEKELRNFARAFQDSGEAMVITDTEYCIEHVNQAFLDLTGFDRNDIIGQGASIFLGGSEEQRDHFKVEKGDKRWTGEHFAKRKNGELFPIRLSVSHVEDDSVGMHSPMASCHCLYSFIDISDIKANQRKLEQLAHHDTLTGLPNRVLFAESVEQAIARAERRRMRFAMLFIDLDNFKYVNDGLGHHAGDQLLIKVAELIRTELRREDLVARLGGDEFVVLLQDIHDVDDVIRLTDKLLDKLDVPFNIKAETVRVTASAGICIYPDDGEDYETLLRKADGAMYQAKDAGKNTHCFSSDDVSQHSAKLLKLDYELHRAIQNRELFLSYQPQIDLSTGKLCGVEALVRWRHPELGVVPPGDFLPVAEKTGLLASLEHWVLRTACEQAKSWRDRDIRFGRVAINLSGTRLEKGQFASEVIDILRDTGCDGADIELEITEDFIMQRANSALEELQELRSRGITLAIDDFGTGYSSLAYLRRLPVDKLKIDKSFITELAEDSGSEQIVMAVIALGKSLDLTVTAEGVETLKQSEILRRKGCDTVQGYYYDKPLFPQDFENKYYPSVIPFRGRQNGQGQ